MKRLFVSQPMRGLTDDEIVAERNRIILKAQEALGEAVAPMRGNYYPPENEAMAARCLGDSIAAMAEADVAVFGKGWENARGCRIMHQVCMDYGIPFVEIYSD